MSVRILHLADVHLGAPLGNFGDYAPRRREELEAAFRRAIDAALAEQAHAVLIAGDLFDSWRPDARAVDLARRELARLREAGVAVLAVPGTHDSLRHPDSVYRRESLPFDRLFDAPDFGEPERMEVDGKALCVYGIASDPRRGGGWSTLSRRPDDGIHVALAHAACRDRPDWEIPPDDLPFEASELSGFAMDYVALGHYHNTRVFEAGDRVVAAYPGSVEGRDWTETGPRHALLVQWDEGRAEPAIREIPIHSRKLDSCELDVSGARSEAEVTERIRSRCPPDILWRIRLLGEPETVLRPESIQAELEAAYGYLQIDDRTTLVTSQRLERLCEEETVRGEFFRRLVREREAATDPRQHQVIERAIRLGVRVLDDGQVEP